MNRTRRRFFEQKRRNAGAQPEPSVFSEMSDTLVCQSIQVLIDELKSRGIDIVDCDGQRLKLKQLFILRGQVYYFAEEDEQDETQKENG